MKSDPKKQARIDEVRVLLNAFSAKYFSPELSGYVNTLWEQIGRKRNFIITGGRKEVWAAAVVYVIARLNFLFDKSNPHYMTADTICDFFETKKSTVSSKAAQIEQACSIRMGHGGLCSSHISDSLTFVELPNGIVVTKEMAKGMGIKI